MKLTQRQVTLSPRSRGYHLVTDEIARQVSELKDIEIGIAHIFIQHTSASLTLNENADPSVRRDFETHMRAMVPEDASYWTHTMEGPDDMPAHIKASLLGAGLTVPIREGRLALGTWQGIYLCEHRNRGGRRSLMITLMGE